MPDPAQPDRATYKFVVHRLSYPELWRLGNGLFNFLFLLQVKWFKLATLDRTDTSSFRTVLLTEAEVPGDLQPGLAAAIKQFTAEGFRYIGLDQETLRAGGCMAHFVRGPVFGAQIVARRLNYIALYSFPPNARPLVTANGRNYIDNSAVQDPILTRGATLAELLQQHAARIASLALPDLTDADVLDAFEKLARDVREHQVARGIFIPQPLAPPLLPKATP